MTLTTRAPGKVNLCLFVGAPRADGLHPLVSVVQPVSLADELTLAPGDKPALARGDRPALAPGAGALARGDRPALAPGAGADRVVCPGVEGENLALRALREFRAATGWDGPPQTLTIVKRVPVAAGMGGGSADAAAALRLASAASGAAIPDGLAMRLGADVPALLRPGRVLMAGAGERVERLRGDDAQALVVVPLDAALSTAAVYRAFDELGGGRTEDELAQLEATVRAGRTPPANDLQRAALRLCAQIAPALEALAAAGAPDPLVSGSGPTIFGLVADAERAAAQMRQAGYAKARAVAPVTEDFAAVRHNEQR